LLERVAVDQERGLERVEAGDPDRIPGPAAYCAEICLAGPDVANESRFRVALAPPPVSLELDAQRPAGAAGRSAPPERRATSAANACSSCGAKFPFAMVSTTGVRCEPPALSKPALPQPATMKSSASQGATLRMPVIAGRFTVVRP